MSDSRFVRVGTDLIPIADIESIDISRIERLYVRVNMKEITAPGYSAIGQDALDLVMKICPSAVEGKRLKFIRNQWAIHNLVGHPLMQILSWMGLSHLGMEIHEKTTPRPIDKK